MLIHKMMLISTVACSMMLLSSCDEKAQQLAHDSIGLLDQRSAQLAAKIGAEKDEYNAFASHASDDHRYLLDLALQNERNELSESLAADYDEGRKPVSLWRSNLATYAQTDFAASRDALAADMNASSQYIADFHDLTVEQDKVDALSKLLAAVAAKPSIKDNITALATFATDTKTDFDVKVCGQLKTQESSTDPATAAAATTAYAGKNCDQVLNP